MKTLLMIVMLLVGITIFGQEVPVAATNTSATNKTTWRWYAVDSADGYRWNDSIVYASSVDLSIDTMVVDSPLTPNTSYTRYFWAYNDCGHSSPLTMTTTTLDDFVCGTSKTKVHTVGTVAPVTKTVVYGTVTNVPGEEELCWLTRNLGATQQGTSFSDSTEASAGWYFQFNRKQGYKYGATRIPSSTWITTINEVSDWGAANDPCLIELGTGWRVPTYVEWTNVKTAGDWGMGSNAYASLIKLHAAGYIESGTLTGRGGAIPKGRYHTGTAYLSSYSYNIAMLSNGFSMSYTAKANATPVRCVKNTDVDTCITAPDKPTSGTHTPATTIIIWVWNETSGAAGFKFGTTTTYASATDLGLVLTKTESSLTQNTAYTRYLWAYNDCGHSDSLILVDTTTLPVPSAPTTATHTPSLTQMIWDWNTSTYADGYKWHTANVYNDATDMATVTTKTETGLTKNTIYTRYVWAYNTYGHSSALTISDTTLNDWVSGDSIVVTHVADTVAPVNKTVTYDIITYVPGEVSKKWTASNLGADQQAASMSDATESSAGWYWQFNRKQGFKRDATTRTPSTTWVNSISESSDWISANDPCTIELGGGWRIPTATEWANVGVYGGWKNANGPWNLLKIHMAGRLYYSGGTMAYRGTAGYYWSSTRESITNGYSLYFTSGTYGIKSYGKSYGFSVRCISE